MDCCVSTRGLDSRQPVLAQQRGSGAKDERQEDDEMSVIAPTCKHCAARVFAIYVWRDGTPWPLCERHYLQACAREATRR